MTNDPKEADFYINTAMTMVDVQASYVYGSDKPWENYADACWQLAWAMVEARKRNVIDMHRVKGQK